MTHPCDHIYADPFSWLVINLNAYLLHFVPGIFGSNFWRKIIIDDTKSRILMVKIDNINLIFLTKK